MAGTDVSSSLSSLSVPIAQLRASLSGAVLVADDAGYDDARRVWNGMIDRRPAVIARCRSTGDVRAAVVFARAAGLPVAVRGGGHSAAGFAVCDGGLVVDLTEMRAVQVDAEQRIAQAQGGATWADFDRAAAHHGLATTGGAISTTGIAGLTLGGGIGWLMRKYGLACDNLIEAEVVTADGNVVNASEDENGDLLWALRGGGGNFGVVTRFTFRLHPVGEVSGGMLVHPADRARDMLRFYRSATANAPDELAVFAGLMTSPEGQPISAMVLCHCGEEEQADRDLKEVRTFGPPIADLVARKPYSEHQQMLDEGFPHGLQVYWKAHFLKDLNDEVIDTVVDHFGRVTSPLSAILFEQLGGAVARADRDAAAVTFRDAPYNLAIISRWLDPSEANTHIEWTRGLFDALRPWATGVYVNYLGVGDDPERVNSAYDKETFERLGALKKRYEPDNVFRFNQNIRPA